MTAPYKPRLCGHCHKPYLPRSGPQKWCSPVCKDRASPAKPKDETPSVTRPSSSLMGAAKIRARLFKEINAFVIANKGWVTSTPGVSPLTFEATDSQIADALKAGVIK
jgi:hypothetical protein